MNASDRILIAGIGNIFFGDDAFGGEVIKELIKSPLPEGVDAVDFGIRSYDLAYAIMDGYAATILVDVTERGEPPGTVYLIELDQAKIGNLEATAPDGHSLDPVAVLRLTQSLGGQIERLYLVACEPAVLETEDGRIELSESVRAAVPEAVRMIRRLVDKLRSEIPSAPDPA
ncbi:MAG TPA: hydrogenase maturation protease [Chthoniobacterales bacterium]|nr:hydrogenase maturation protease [Chthoniobacterales bacterium]